MKKVSHKFFTESMRRWVTVDKLWIKPLIRERLVSIRRRSFCEHHMSHAAASFFCSPFEHAAIITVDGRR